MNKYRVVFTDIRTHEDYVGEVPESKLITIIMSLIGDGWMLSELSEITND